MKEIIQRARPGLFVSCSHEVWPIIREYERTSTAVIGAYVQPKVAHYLTELQAALARSGVGAELKVTKSNGGVMSAEHGKSDCVQIILSGTASGVIGASYIADQCGIRRCMSLDVGGTSADVALITDGQPQFASGERIGDFQIHIPSVSVTSIGDGGGSIAWVDAHGVLKVGPHSAGSSPGPVCYRRGGDRPTITDAFAVMGVLGHAALGYDSVTPDVAAAREAIAGLAVRLGHTVEKTAEAIVRVSISSMYAGVSRLVSRFGVDPREFTLLPFGGAGPMLACYLARELEMPRVLVPTTPGVLSALGGLIADTKNDFVKTTYYDLDAEGLRKLRVDAKDLEARAREWMSGEIGSSEHARIRVSADMRYRGQAYNLTLPFGGRPVTDATLRDAILVSRPQRTLLTVTLTGLPYGPEVFAHRSAAGGRHNAFTVITDQGESWLGPYLHKDAGPTWTFLGWALPGTDWERRFSGATSAASALEVVTGLRRVTGGSVHIGGQNMTNAAPRKVTAQGQSCHVPEDRHAYGMVDSYSVAHNLVLNTYYLPPFAKNATINERAINSHAEELVAKFDVRTPNVQTLGSNLSGGNQQKMVVAREFSRPIQLLIAAQPTRGIDVGSIEFIHNQIVEKRDEDVAVLVVSSELDEIMALSDRIAVMYKGEIIDIVAREDATREGLGLLMAGVKAH